MVQQYTSSKLIADCNGGKRTTCVGEDGEGTTKVESMGWATIIAAYMGDKTTFDGLIKFYKSKLQSHGMMDWKTGCSGDVDDDKGSASDGDLDVAFGSLVAAWQWGGNYVTEAKSIINTCKKLIVDCNGTSVLAAGMGGGGNSPYGGCSETDLSYYTPAFFREFAKFTGDNAWSKLADDTYFILEKTANQNTGLVPDWHTYNGQQYTGQPTALLIDMMPVEYLGELQLITSGMVMKKHWHGAKKYLTGQMELVLQILKTGIIRMVQQLAATTIKHLLEHLLEHSLLLRCVIHKLLQTHLLSIWLNWEPIPGTGITVF